ncbi:MAG TPA: DUF5666 domain-containing protein [Candidatus Paceibacterota bacterium]|nr:DUF5666 domain-containing protein [Candidatus Paceibacterota bacterium]
MKKKLPMQFAGVAVVALLVGFYGGMQYGQGLSNSAANSSGAGRFGNGQYGGQASSTGRRGGPGGGGLVTGSIISMDSSSITVQMQTGGSKIVLYSPSTQIGKFVTSSDLSGLSVGARVMVQGSTNSDGSVTAQMIQIRPADMPRPNSTSTPPGAPGQ